MALEGTIKDFGLPDIFQLIGLQRKTGNLTLTNEKSDETVTVTFENGMVVMADSSARRLEDRLGNVLVKQGKLSRMRLEEALEVQEQTLQRLGHILSSGSVITAKDLRDALQVQVSQIVFRVFRWRDGRYQFSPSDSVDYDRENFAPMSADFILMEGIRMVDEWPIIEKKIPSFDIVFRPVVDPMLIEVGAPGPDDSGEFRRGAPAASGRICLTPDEDRVFRRVDGERTVQAIIDAAGVGEFEVCRTLFDFLNRNLIAPEGRGETPALEEGEAKARASSMPGYAVAALVVLLAAAGLLARLGSPFLVSGRPPVVEESWDLVIDGVTWSRLARLDQAIHAWKSTYGAPPQTLEELVEAGLVDRSYLRDPARRPFHYETGSGGYLLSAVDDAGQSRPDVVLDRRAGT
ncbi:MAG: DUF4388 domain-containing protein [Acidobacteria bacterium]|nr:DUF4388 domain-containing protein [Acidobacteriota bacterium]